MSTQIRKTIVVAAVAGFAAVQSTGAQIAPAVAAPVPTAVIAAKRIFISNAGSQTYGSESYFSLTRYDGGPDRFYNAFYAAMKRWGRFDLAPGPDSADVVYELRFTNPIVDRVNGAEIYDPQLNVAILDPRTRIALWSLTEHIQPARTLGDDNRNFDSAVGRIVERVKLLTSSVPSFVAAQSLADFAPPGARPTASQARWSHVFVGSTLGGLAGFLLAMNGSHPCTPTSCGPSLRHVVGLNVSGVLTGAMIGLLWPVK